jgi:hypothetical protein
MIPNLPHFLVYLLNVRLNFFCFVFFFFIQTGTFEASEKKKTRAACRTAEKEEGERSQWDEPPHAFTETPS